MLEIVDGNREFQYVIYGADGVSLYNEKARKELGFGATAGCVYRHRLFLAVKPFRILYSKPGEPDEFSEALDESGEIFHFGGKGDTVVAMETLGECIYLFTGHGIARLHVKGAAREFVLEEVAYAGGEIFGDSVGKFGDRICFLASDGVYLLDGNRVKKGYEKLPIFPKGVGQVCEYGVFEGKYLLRYVDVEGEQTLVLHSDGENGYVTFPMQGLCSLEGEAIFQNQGDFCYLDQNGVLPNAETAIFTSEKLDFGGRVALREICLTGKGSVTVCVTADGVQESVTMELAGGKTRAKLRCFGEEFTIDLRLNGVDAKVRALELRVEKAKG
jgi:hypothetical protein